MDKKQLLDSLDAHKEAAELLGPIKGGKYRCYNKSQHANGDKNPSLTMNPSGYWACHSCGERGDLIQLFMNVNNMSHSQFAEAITILARKNGLDTAATVRVSPKSAKNTDRKQMGKVVARKAICGAINDMENKKYNKGVKEWLLAHYGINQATIERFQLGWSSSATRLFIPIPLKALKTEDGKYAPCLLYTSPSPRDRG